MTNIKTTTILLFFLFVFQNVEAQQNYDKQMSKALNDKVIYENERDSISKLLYNKMYFFKPGDIDKEFREKQFSDKDVNAWRDSIKQATNILNQYSYEYVTDLKNNYDNYPTRFLEEEESLIHFKRKDFRLEQAFYKRTVNIHSEKNWIDVLSTSSIESLIKSYAVVGETFRADGTETYLSQWGTYERILPAGDYIIIDNEIKKVSGGKKDWNTIKLKSKKKNKRYSLVLTYSSLNYTQKFLGIQKKIQELNEQLDYSKSPENQQAEQIRKKIKELDLKVDSLRQLPNPYNDEHQKIMGLVQTLSKGKAVLDKAISNKESEHYNLTKQQKEERNKIRQAEWNKEIAKNKAETEKRKNNLISKYGNEIGNRIYNKNYWVGMKEEYLKEGGYSVTLVHRDSNTRVYRYMDMGFAYNDLAFIYKYAIFKNGKLTSLVDNFTITN